MEAVSSLPRCIGSALCLPRVAGVLLSAKLDGCIFPTAQHLVAHRRSLYLTLCPLVG